jgi:hypothetical protein
MRNNHLVDLIVSAVAILASLAAVAAFGLTVTRTPRLVRRAGTLKEAIGTVSPKSTQHGVLSQMHLEVTAEIVARQLTPVWRVVWPWLAWAVTAGLSSQIGYQTVKYLVETNGFNYTDWTVAAFGDTPGPILLLLSLIGPLPMVCASYLTTIWGRADVALAFFNGESLDRPVTYTDLSSRWEDRHNRPSEKAQKDGPPQGADSKMQGFLSWLALVAPGTFLVSFGFFVGTAIAMDTISPKMFKGSAEAERRFMIDQLGSLVGIMALVVTVSSGLMLWAVSEIRSASEGSRMPTHYPAGESQL